MARQYDQVKIDDITYELHPTKSDSRDIGSVPVRVLTLEEFQEHVVNASAGELELIHSDWRYGNGVRLQRMARDTAAGDRKFTDNDFNRIADNIGAEELKAYAGKMGRLREYCKELWLKQKTDISDEYNKEYVHEYLI